MRRASLRTRRTTKSSGGAVRCRPRPRHQGPALSQTDTALRRGRTSGTTAPHGAYAGQHWDEDLGLSYAQQRWYSPGTGRFLSEDPVGWNAERLGQPTRGHAFGYAAGNPLLYTDPEGLDVGQPDSTTKRAQEDMSYEAARNEWSKEEGNWVTGCLAAEADNWRHIDSAAFSARSKSPGWLAGYLKCQGRPAVDAWYNSDIGKTTREFWTATPGRAQTMGCVLGGGNGVLPVGDVSSLPEGMQSTAAACEFGVGAATAVVTLGEAGVGVWRGLKNMRPMPRPALAGVTTEGRTASVADSVPNTMAMAADDAGRLGGVAAKPAVPPRVQSRINIQTGSAEQGVGWKHVVDRHFGSKNASRFTIPEEELRKLLQSKEVVATPISRVLASADGPRYVREVTLGGRGPIGLDKFSGWKPTSTMTVLTDGAGNLVTVTPGVIK